MQKLNWLKILFLSAMCLSPTFAANNRMPKQIGKYQNWTAYVMNQDGRKVCYMVGFPTSMKGKYSKRGKAYALVTHRPAENSHNVFSVHAGYPFSNSATVKTVIDKQRFTLFTDEFETAWAPDKADIMIANAIIKGRNMVVIGASRRGTKTEDQYSLNGSAQALRAMNRACGIK